ncbi:hypothetical protein [Kitasatospora sp. NPDC051914]|uniref:hypothetical protein n=1 Tax=Kitasatospora sp. NPDC051914 TaxID=3154945 RepID=UPI003418B742
MPARNRRLPRHLSWPLTPTDLREALGGEPVAPDAVSFDGHPWGDGTLLQVTWLPPTSSNYGQGIHPGLWNTLQIAVAPLPAGERAAARELLRGRVLPELRAWIANARQAPEGWKLSPHSRSWRIEDGTVTRGEDGQPYR